MIQIPKIDFVPIIEIAKRRKWWIIIPLVLSLLGGGAYIYVTPKSYQANTMILVEAQRVPSSYVQSTITESLQSRLHTISQQVHSRTNIEKIIKNYNLGPRPEEKEGSVDRIKDKFRSLLHLSKKQKAKPKWSMEDLVENIRKKIEVSIRSHNRAFEIFFQWHDPKVAADVANAIASQFIEQNLQVREEMAMGTTRFLDAEVERLKLDLQKREKALEEFKWANMGMLPEQLQSNLAILNQLKDELNNLEQRITIEKQQSVILKNQMALIGSLDFGLGVDLGQDPESSGDLIDLETKFNALKTKYTDNYPDLVVLKRRIAKLKAQEESQDNQDAATKQPAAQDQTASLTETAPQNTFFESQFEQSRQMIADYEKHIRKVKDQIKLYQIRMENIPKVELQLKNLQRDYQTVNERYHDLLAKKLNAQMAEELEKRQKGEQFRVIDSAVAPDKPFKPHVKKVLLLSLVLGLGIGGGLAFLREGLDPVFYTPEDIETYLPGVKVIVSLPLEKDKKA